MTPLRQAECPVRGHLRHFLQSTIRTVAQCAEGEQDGIDSVRSLQTAGRDASSGSAARRSAASIGGVTVVSGPSNLPCTYQPKSLTELRNAFNKGRIPSSSETTGSWVAIGSFVDYGFDLSCTGIKRESSKFEQVMLVNGYSVEMHVVGTIDQVRTMASDHAGSLMFPVDFGGDANPVYRCRISQRKTLMCLVDVYRQGFEFKKASVSPDQIYSSR